MNVRGMNVTFEQVRQACITLQGFVPQNIALSEAAAELIVTYGRDEFRRAAGLPDRKSTEWLGKY